MDLTSAIALAGTTVALTTWAVTQLITLASARRETRRQLVVRVLDTVDALVKQQMIPVALAAWSRKEIDLTLLQSRFALDLKPRDQVISRWVWAQTQRLLIATNEKEVTTRAATIGGALALWHQGRVNRSWFAAQLVIEPVMEHFEVPRAAKWRLSGRNFRETLGAGVILTVVGLAAAQVRELGRELA